MKLFLFNSKKDNVKSGFSSDERGLALEDLTDEKLALKLQENKNIDDVFAIIIDRYTKKLQRYIDRISSFPTQDKEDILQEIFIKIYKNINSYNTSLKFSSWVYRITHNETISHFRKNKKFFGNVSVEENQGFVENAYSENAQSIEDNDYFSTENMEKIFDQNINQKILKQGLEKLKINEKEILVLKYFENLSYGEISDILKIPKNTVGTNVSRAKKKLKNLLSGEAGKI